MESSRKPQFNMVLRRLAEKKNEIYDSTEPDPDDISRIELAEELFSDVENVRHLWKETIAVLMYLGFSFEESDSIYDDILKEFDNPYILIDPEQFEAKYKG